MKIFQIHQAVFVKKVCDEAAMPIKQLSGLNYPIKFKRLTKLAKYEQYTVDLAGTKITYKYAEYQYEIYVLYRKMHKIFTLCLTLYPGLIF